VLVARRIRVSETADRHKCYPVLLTEKASMRPRTRRIVDDMRSNLHRKLSLDAIAKTGSLSRSHLCHSFKAEIGMSVGQYLKALRMKKAGELLETTSLSVKQIAAEVGMNDQSHFVRTFKKTYGQTPSEYRQNPGAQSALSSKENSTNDQ
jgi:transcriptional regulator GlxA family with amidase domain